MHYRIRAVPEVEAWLDRLREAEPRAAELADTAVLLAAGTERDWLEAWYAEMIPRCRARHQRYLSGLG